MEAVCSFNELVGALNANSKSDATIAAVIMFNKLMTRSFALEEHYMEHYRFQDNVVHSDRHKNYLNRLGGLSNQIVSGDEVTDQVLSYFCGWLTHHVSITDKIFATFIREHHQYQKFE